MILGIGVDIVDNRRIEKSYKEDNKSFLLKFLSQQEVTSLKNENISHIAGLFAVKEASIKAIGQATGNIASFFDVTLAYKNNMIMPYIHYQKKDLSKAKFHVSISHEKYYTVAVVICELL